MTPVRREDDQMDTDFRPHRQERSAIWQWGVGLSITIIGILFAWVIQPLNTKIDNITVRMVAVETKSDTAKEQRTEQIDATRELTRETNELRMEVIGLRAEMQRQGKLSSASPYYDRGLPKFGSK